MAPVVCMITGGSHAGPASNDTIARIAAAARAGVSLVQIRERHAEGGPLCDLVRRAVRAVAGTQARILVNDRLDVALGAGAHGVHLRRDSMSASRVRAISPRGFIVGRSVHDVEHAVAATAGGGLDYLVFGTVFTTSSKPGRAPAGLAALARVVLATPLPVLAVGGIGPSAVPAVAAAGAAGFSAISMFAGVPLDRLGDLVGDARAAFRVPGRAV